MSSSATPSSFAAAAARWSLTPEAQSSLRREMLTLRSTPAPPPTRLADPPGKDDLVADIVGERLRAEARLERLQIDDDDEAEEEEDDSAESEEEEEEKQNGEESDEESEEEDEDEDAEYENELEYMVHEILCLDAINHDLPSGKEVPCSHCSDGTKFESEFACSACALQQGVCPMCRKVMVLRTLDQPDRGAAVCLALLADEALMRDTFEIEAGADGEEELHAIRGQITAMLDAYFDSKH